MFSVCSPRRTQRAPLTCSAILAGRPQLPSACALSVSPFPWCRGETEVGVRGETEVGVRGGSGWPGQDAGWGDEDAPVSPLTSSAT